MRAHHGNVDSWSGAWVSIRAFPREKTQVKRDLKLKSVAAVGAMTRSSYFCQ